jgi:hypothetical protein
MPTRARVQSLIDHVLQGKIVPAIEEFYADSVTMQENLHPPTVGKAANLEREKQFVAYVKQFHSATGDIIAIDGDNVVIHWTMDFDAVDGKRVVYNQLAWQTWSGDHIVRERFVYDSGAAA